MPNLYQKEGVENRRTHEIIAELTLFVDELMEDDFYAEASGVGGAIEHIRTKFDIHAPSDYYIDKAQTARLHSTEAK